MKMTERWLPIPGYGGRYDVSSQGAVRSWVPWRGMALPHQLSAGRGGNGYLVVCLSGDAGMESRTVHSLVLLAFEGPLQDGQVVRHIDGDKSNNDLTNLRYGSQSENAMDCLRHGNHFHATRTHCPAGHEYDHANTFIDKQGGRRCRTCARLRSARHRQGAAA